MIEGFFIAVFALLVFGFIMGQAAQLAIRGRRSSRRWKKRYKTGRVHGVWYDSSYERDYIRYAVELDASIASIQRYDEGRRPMPYFYGGRKRRYYPDFVVRHVDGKERIIEIKGSFTRKSRAKYKRYRDVVKWYFAPACMDIKRKVAREALPLAELKRRGLYEPDVERERGRS